MISILMMVLTSQAARAAFLMPAMPALKMSTLLAHCINASSSWSERMRSRACSLCGDLRPATGIDFDHAAIEGPAHELLERSGGDDFVQDTHDIAQLDVDERRSGESLWNLPRSR